MGRLIRSDYDDLDDNHDGYCPNCGNVVYENVVTPERRTDWGYQQEEKETICGRCGYQWERDELIHDENKALDIEEKYFEEKNK